MTIREKHQDLAKKYHWVFPIIIPVLLGYFGVDQYQMYEKRQEEASKAGDVVVTITTPDTGETHSHGRVVSQNDIETLIMRHMNVVLNQMNTAIKEQHEKDLLLFKKKEAWDKD